MALLDVPVVSTVDLVDRRKKNVVAIKVIGRHKSSSRSRTAMGVIEPARRPKKYLWELSESSLSESSVHT